MARSNKARELASEEVKLDTTPIIDVTFLLLIFFMCTLKFKTLEGKLVSYLPTDKGLARTPQPVLEKEDAEIILKIPKEDWSKKPTERVVTILRNGGAEPFGRITHLNIDPINPKNIQMICEPSDTMERVKKYLDEVRGRAPDTKARINSHARTPHLYVVYILNLMIDAGFSDISYSGIPNTLVKDLLSGELNPK